LSGGRRVIVASTRGGMYSAGPGSVTGFQEAYLKAVFGFLGITDVKFDRAERLTKGGEVRSQSMKHRRRW
jgi:FMN-dependent NADH-azoreductase